MTSVKHSDQRHDVYSALAPELIELATQIADEADVSLNDVLIEAARDGLTAIKPRWEARQRRAS
jgi:hypothetical protein